VHEIDAILVPDDDHGLNPLGIKGIGELGIVGVNRDRERRAPRDGTPHPPATDPDRGSAARLSPSA